MRHQLILLSILLAFSLFQCKNGAEQANSSAIETTPSQTTAPLATESTATSPASAESHPPPADPIVATAVDANKIKSAVTEVRLEATSTVTPTPANTNQPTVKNTPPPTPVRETKEQVTEEMQEEVSVVVEEAPAPEKQVQAPAHSRFDAILRNAVSASGKVNYAAIKANSAELDAYLKDTEINAPSSDWGKARTMAYWINVYNANTLKLVADSYPISSVKELHGGNPWDVKWIRIGENKYSLNQIENDFLRARYGDARIHFAVNCAAKSCPPLHNRAFTEANLNSKLQQLSRSFLSNESYNTINENELEVSQIFNWYAKDFGTLTAFIDRYTKTTINSDATITYKEYDWSLNN